MSAPARLPAASVPVEKENPTPTDAVRPDLLPLAVLGMPVAMLPCAALTAAIGVWALALAAMVLTLLVGAAAWSAGGQR